MHNKGVTNVSLAFAGPKCLLGLINIAIVRSRHSSTIEDQCCWMCHGIIMKPVKYNSVSHELCSIFVTGKLMQNCFFKLDPCGFLHTDMTRLLPSLLNFRPKLKPRRPLRSFSGRWRFCGQQRRPLPWLRRGCWRRTAVSLTLPGRKCSTMPHRG